MPVVRTSIACVGAACQTYLIPHVGNGYRPHLLHPKRTVTYAALAAAAKLALLAVAVALPAGIFASDEALDAQSRIIIAETNVLRASASIPALAPEPRLARSASAKAADMAARGYFAHTSPDGRTPDAFIRAAGYPFAVAGENLAMGFTDPREVVAAWARSPTHRRNLLDAEFADVGIGARAGSFNGAAAAFTAQHFGRAVVPAAPPPASPITVNRAKTRVLWETAGERTRVAAIVTAAGTFDGAAVEVQGVEIPLAPVPEAPGVFEGQAELPVPARDLFRVVTPPVLTVEQDGRTVASQTLAWNTPPAFAPTVGDVLARARALLPKTFGPLDGAVRFILLAALALFAVAWFVNLLVEIRHQHVDLLVPGGALVLLLAALVLI